MMKPKAVNEHEDGMLEFLEDIIGSSRYQQPISSLSQRVDELNELRAEKVLKHVCVCVYITQKYIDEYVCHLGLLIYLQIVISILCVCAQISYSLLLPGNRVWRALPFSLRCLLVAGQVTVEPLEIVC